MNLKDELKKITQNLKSSLFPEWEGDFYPTIKKILIHQAELGSYSYDYYIPYKFLDIRIDILRFFSNLGFSVVDSFNPSKDGGNFLRISWEK